MGYCTSYSEEGVTCCYCLKDIHRYTMEHLIPRSKGGNNTMYNKRECCPDCNSLRGNKDYAEFHKILQEAHNNCHNPEHRMHYATMMASVERWMNYIRKHEHKMVRGTVVPLITDVKGSDYGLLIPRNQKKVKRNYKPVVSDGKWEHFKQKMESPKFKPWGVKRAKDLHYVDEFGVALSTDTGKVRHELIQSKPNHKAKRIAKVAKKKASVKTANTESESGVYEPTKNMSFAEKMQYWMDYPIPPIDVEVTRKLINRQVTK